MRSVFCPPATSQAWAKEWRSRCGCTLRIPASRARLCPSRAAGSSRDPDRGTAPTPPPRAECPCRSAAAGSPGRVAPRTRGRGRSPAAAAGRCRAWPATCSRRPACIATRRRTRSRSGERGAATGPGLGASGQYQDTNIVSQSWCGQALWQGALPQGLQFWGRLNPGTLSGARIRN